MVKDGIISTYVQEHKDIYIHHSDKKRYIQQGVKLPQFADNKNVYIKKSQGIYKKHF